MLTGGMILHSPPGTAAGGQHPAPSAVQVQGRGSSVFPPAPVWDLSSCAQESC